MALLVKNGVKFSVRDANHLSAFLNNGWVVDDSTKETENDSDEVKTDNTEGSDTDNTEGSDTDNTEDTDTDNTTKQYSKSDITHMSTADLKTLAPTLGIEVTEESTGAKLKEEIIAKLGL